MWISGITGRFSVEIAESHTTIPVSGPSENFRWAIKFYIPVRARSYYGLACTVIHKK